MGISDRNVADAKKEPGTDNINTEVEAVIIGISDRNVADVKNDPGTDIKTEMEPVILGINDRNVADVKNEPGTDRASEMEADGPSSTKVSVGQTEIMNGIAALKKTVPWPAEMQIMPTYTDESGTIYLQFQTRKANGPAGRGFLGKVVLPHCLSTKRSVCVVARGMDNEEKSNEMVTLLRGLGVVGEIKTMPLSELQAALRNQDTETLEAVARRYDTHLGESYARQKIGRKMAPYMDQFSKSFNWFDIGLMKVPKRFGEETLGKADLFVSPSCEGYVVKVGHMGFTDDQLAENIRAGLDKIDFWTSLFPEGLKHFTTVHIKTGITDGVPIFVNTGEVMDEPPRKIREEETKAPSADEATAKRGRKRKPKNKPDQEQFPKKLHLMDM